MILTRSLCSSALCAVRLRLCLISGAEYPLQLHGSSIDEFLHACLSIAQGFSLPPSEFARAFSDYRACHAAHRRILSVQDLHALRSWIGQQQQQQPNQRDRTLREIRMNPRPASASPAPRPAACAGAARRKPVVRSAAPAPAVLTVPLDLTSAAMSAQMQVQAAKQHQLKEMARIVAVSLASAQQPRPHTAATTNGASSHSARTTNHRAASHSSPSQHPDPEARANYLRWVAAAASSSSSGAHTAPADMDGEEGLDAAAERKRERRQRKAMRLLHQQLSNGNGTHHTHAAAAEAEASASSHSAAASSPVAVAPAALTEDLFPSFTSPERHLLSAWFRDAQLKHAALASQLAELRDTQQRVLRALESTGSGATGAEAEEVARLAQETQKSIAKLAEQVAMLKQPEMAVRQLSEQHAAAQAARQAQNGNSSFTSHALAHTASLDHSTASAPLLASAVSAPRPAAPSVAVVSGRARTRPAPPVAAAPVAAPYSQTAPAAALLIPGVLPKHSITQERKQRQQQLMVPSAVTAASVAMPLTHRSMRTDYSVTQPHSQPHSRRASITSVASSPQLLNRHTAVSSSQHWRSSSAERSSASPPTSHRSASSAALERFYSPSRFKVDAAGVQSGEALAAPRHRTRAASLTREEQAQWADSLVEAMVVDLPEPRVDPMAGRYRSPFPPREPPRAVASFPSARDRHRSPSLDPPPYTRYTHTLHKHLSNVRAQNALSPPRPKSSKPVRDTFGPART